MFIDSPECFEGLGELKHLDLSGNQLTTLNKEYETFRELRELDVLDLSNNKLSWISPNVFSPLMLLTRLNLNGNKMTGEIKLITVTHTHIF